MGGGGGGGGGNGCPGVLDDIFGGGGGGGGAGFSSIIELIFGGGGGGSFFFCEKPVVEIKTVITSTDRQGSNFLIKKF